MNWIVSTSKSQVYTLHRLAHFDMDAIMHKLRSMHNYQIYQPSALRSAVVHKNIKSKVWWLIVMLESDEWWRYVKRIYIYFCNILRWNEMRMIHIIPYLWNINLVGWSNIKLNHPNKKRRKFYGKSKSKVKYFKRITHYRLLAVVLTSHLE